MLRCAGGPGCVWCITLHACEQPERTWVTSAAAAPAATCGRGREARCGRGAARAGTAARAGGGAAWAALLAGALDSPEGCSTAAARMMPGWRPGAAAGRGLGSQSGTCARLQHAPGRSSECLSVGLQRRAGNGAFPSHTASLAAADRQTLPPPQQRPQFRHSLVCALSTLPARQNKLIARPCKPPLRPSSRPVHSSPRCQPRRAASRSCRRRSGLMHRLQPRCPLPAGRAR